MAPALGLAKFPSGQEATLCPRGGKMARGQEGRGGEAGKRTSAGFSSNCDAKVLLSAEAIERCARMVLRAVTFLRSASMSATELTFSLLSAFSSPCSRFPGCSFCQSGVCAPSAEASDPVKIPRVFSLVQSASTAEGGRRRRSGALVRAEKSNNWKYGMEERRR